MAPIPAGYTPKVFLFIHKKKTRPKARPVSSSWTRSADKITARLGVDLVTDILGQRLHRPLRRRTHGLGNQARIRHKQPGSAMDFPLGATTES